MAGAGYKLFNTGDVLTAAQVNTYLQEQVVMVFANAAARTTALSGVLAEGMVSYLKDTDALEIYSGTAWVGYGSGDITGVTAGTGLSGGGASGSVTLSLSVPVTEVNGGTNQTTYTTGDLLYASGSNTLAKRSIGTTGQILTVSGGVPTWATASASSSALTKITDGSFSNQATVDIDNIFSTTYLTYMAIIQVNAVTATDGFEIQFRYAGPSTETTNYYTSAFQYDRGNTLTTAGALNASAARLLVACGASGDPSYMTVYFREVGNSSGDNPVYWGSGQSRLQSIANFAGYNDVQRLYTGIRLKSSSSNITGNYRIYGLAN